MANANFNLSKISRAVRAAIAFLFTSKRNGFVGTAPALDVDAIARQTQQVAELCERQAAQESKRTPQEQAAAEELGNAPTFLFSLDNFAENCKRMPQDFFAVRYAVAGLCDQARKHYATTGGKLPAKHPARKHLDRAAGALDSLQQFMRIMDDSLEADAANPTEAFRVMVGEVMRFYVALSGRHMERAEQAMSGTAKGWTCGYLQGMGLEADDLRQVSDAEIAMLQDFRKLDKRRQGAAVRFLASLANRQE